MAHGYGVNLDARGQDELYFTGYDMDGRPGYRHAYYDDYSDGEPGNDSDAALVRAALDRIARAKTKGKTNVNLSLEEMEAFERKNGVQQHEYLASPPMTPKSTKAKLSGKSGSLTNVVDAKTRKKSSSPATPKSTPKSNSKAKISRKSSTDGAAIYHPGSPSVLVQGPDGMPMYAPLAYYPPEYAAMPRSRSRSTSQSSRRDTTPPDQIYAPYPIRYFPPASGKRPASASSARPFAEEIDMQPRRNRSGSTAQYRVNEDYTTVPAVHGRNMSGPPGIAFSTLRRVPQASSPLAPRPYGPQHTHSDPNVGGRKVESGSSSDDQGVQVDIVPDPNGAGYSINRSHPKDETRRRKSRR